MNQPVAVASATFGFAESTGKRKSQQDFLKWSGMERPSGANAAPRPRLIVLADGMGGHVGGETASRLATAAFIDACPHGDLGSGDLLMRGLAGANAGLAQAIRADPSLAGMGCTLLAVELAPGDRGFRWISVGDSLLMRVAGARLERLNEDHSFRAEVLAARQRGADTSQMPRGNVLKSAVMGDPIPEIDDAHAAVWTEFAPGETLVLATDGIDTLSDARICEIIAAHPDAREAARALVAAVDAADRPRQDNTTVAVIHAPARPAVAVAAAEAAASRPQGARAAGLATGHWTHGALGIVFTLGLIVGGASLWAWQALNPPRGGGGAPVGPDIALPAPASTEATLAPADPPAAAPRPATPREAVPAPRHDAAHRPGPVPAGHDAPPPGASVVPPPAVNSHGVPAPTPPPPRAPAPTVTGAALPAPVPTHAPPANQPPQLPGPEINTLVTAPPPAGGPAPHPR